MPTDQRAQADAHQYCPTLTRRKITDENALRVDVREADEVTKPAFDVPNVVHLPMSEFERRCAELPRDRERERIPACSVGPRSLKASCFLMYHGDDKRPRGSCC